jgi:hypothetical protein
MVALLAFASIAGGIATAVLASPIMGFWAFAFAPLGASFAIILTGLLAGGKTNLSSTDEMVEDLRSVLPDRCLSSKDDQRRSAA